MSEEIDLSKPPPNDACIPCTIATLQSEPHKGTIEPGKHFLDLVHSDVVGPLQIAHTGARYAVTFLDDFHKVSEVYFLKEKADVFKAVKHYCDHYERGDNRIRRLRTDWGGEYSSEAWDEF